MVFSNAHLFAVARYAWHHLRLATARHSSEAQLAAVVHLARAALWRNLAWLVMEALHHATASRQTSDSTLSSLAFHTTNNAMALRTCSAPGALA